MEIQIIDATYGYDADGFPVITLFGLTRKGEPVTKYVTGFLPYFYIDSGDIEKINGLLDGIASSIGILAKTEIVDRFGPLGYQSKPRKMIKVTTRNPKDVKILRGFCEETGCTTYESDILFKDRFMIDHELTGMGWCIVPSKPYIRHTDIIPQVDQRNAPIKIMAIDIEAIPKENGGLPTPDENPIVLISLAFDPPWRDQQNVVMVSKQIDCNRKDVIVSTGEREMLDRLGFIFDEYDPTVIAGYNSNGFDIPYITDRAKRLGVSLSMSRDGKSAWCKSYMGKHTVSLNGRISLDMLPAIRALDKYRLKSYSLANVAKEILKSEKLDVSPGQMKALWEGPGITKFISYSRRDALLVLQLVQETGVLDKYIALAKASGAFLQVVVNGGQSSMIEAKLIREYNAEDRVMGTKITLDDDDIAQVEGAIVLDPKIGLTENVVILDFKSLYPTTMIARNLCYTTEVREECPDCNLIISPSGGRFVPPEIRKGIVPRVLEKLLSERIKAKTAMKTPGISDIDARQLDAKQYAMKILLNSFYGYSGYARARLYSPVIANSVTSYGRENLLKTREMIMNHKNFELGDNTRNLNVISGDSITGDRCVTVRENGIIKVLPIEKIFDTGKAFGIGEKEYRNCNMEALTHLGWKPIRYVMRHFTDKKIYRVNQKYGESIVTEDHSFVDINMVETKPNDMANTRMYKCKIPPISCHLQSIDLFEYVKYFKYDMMYKGNKKISKFSIYNEDYLKFGWTNRRDPILIKRFIKGGDLVSLCILLGGYITNGSSTFGSRKGASICDSNVSWLMKMQTAYSDLFFNAKTCIIESSKKIRTLQNGTIYKDETRKLQMMNETSAAVFAALCGHGALNKKLPDFAYNLERKFQDILWSELLAGDGHINADGLFEYSTISTQLASGIDTLLNIMNIENRIKFRESKHEYTIREYKNRKAETWTKISEQPSNCYVYDLSVEDAHTFVDSMGQILLHNTDSVFVAIDGKVDFNTAEKIGKKIATTVTDGLPKPMELVFEAYAKRILILAKKHYAMYRFESEGKGEIKAKGIETVRRDWCNFTSKALTKCLETILIDGDVDAALAQARNAIAVLKNPTPDIFNDLVMSRTLTRNPENYAQQQPHAELVKKLEQRGVFKYAIGDRVPFIIVASQRRSGHRSELMTSRAEDPDYAIENNLKIDTNYYLQKQLIPPLLRIFESFGINELDLLQPSRQQSLTKFEIEKRHHIQQVCTT